MHEDPQVPNYGKQGSGKVIKDGLAIAIEPMINLGKAEVRVLSDEWTVVTVDKKKSAHFEHTVAVWEDRTEILTLTD
jgi:methionyl aminopeptidase